MKLGSGWWGQAPLLEMSGWSTDDFNRHLQVKVRHLTDTGRTVDLTKEPGIYYLENHRYEQLRYVGQTRKSLAQRLYEHIIMAFSEGYNSEPLSFPLLCTTEEDWEVQVLPVKQGKKEEKTQFQERLKALETMFIGRNRSCWPRGLNFQMPLDLNTVATIPALQERFVSYCSQPHLLDELISPP